MIHDSPPGNPPTKLAPCSSDFVHVHQTAMKPTSEVQRRGKGPRRSQRKGSCNQLHLFLLGILGYPERGIPLETWEKTLEISVLIQHFWSPTNQPTNQPTLPVPFFLRHPRCSMIKCGLSKTCILRPRPRFDDVTMSHGFSPWENIWGFPKNRGIYPKMDGENHGKPY